MTHPSPPWRADAVIRAERAGARARSRFSALFVRLYRIGRLRGLVRRLCLRSEGGLMWSATWRDILAQYHQVEVGRYSYGSILTPGVLPKGSKIGAYCSVGSGLIVRRRNHPVERPILHPFFYNNALGLLNHDTIEADQDNPLEIGHDVWIGDRVTILSGCRHIGNGAVLAAGAVITRDVAPYTIVAGVPAKPLKPRFDADTIARIEDSAWWTRDIYDLIQDPPFDDVFGAQSPA